jgi:hypothetical protein
VVADDPSPVNPRPTLERHCLGSCWLECWQLPQDWNKRGQAKGHIKPKAPPRPRSIPHKKSIVLDSQDQMLIAPAGNTWREKVSANKKRRRLNARLHAGIHAYLHKKKGAARRCSFLTLTIDPQDHTPKQAYDQMCKAWNALSTWWRKRYPSMKFFRTVECHQNTFPHFHILLIGAPFIQQKAIVEQWKNLLGQSRAVVDIRAVKNNQHAVRYVTKYLLKQSEHATKLEEAQHQAFKTKVDHALEWQKAANQARKDGHQDYALECEREARKIVGEGLEGEIAQTMTAIKKAKREYRTDDVVLLENRLTKLHEQSQAQADKPLETTHQGIADAPFWTRRVRPWSASRGLLEQPKETDNKWWQHITIRPKIDPWTVAQIAYARGWDTETFDVENGVYLLRSNAPNIQA